MAICAWVATWMADGDLCLGRNLDGGWGTERLNSCGPAVRAAAGAALTLMLYAWAEE
ncbi:hypothetical protein [Paenibacillus stellifer]|uniref:hypothetical protein n=1 Tax=Paenibacillus stellifer TaxID=169760 RepID=UPI000B1303B9|nr:hypothetical protein [Paenibacillus stellifer]